MHTPYVAVIAMIQLVHQRVRPYNDHTLNQLDDLALFSINATILCGIFFQTQELDSWGSNLAGLGLATALAFVGVYLMWFAVDEVFANIPATAHLGSVHVRAALSCHAYRVYQWHPLADHAFC